MGRKDYEAKLAAVVDSLIEPGEEKLGTTMATKQSTFKGTMVALVMTDRRLILQEMNRKFEPNGVPLSITSENLESAKLSKGTGSWSDSPSSMIMDKASITIKIRTTDGQKMNLVMMHGQGLLGGLGGGAVQRDSVNLVLERLGLADYTQI
jgi:hypothetical protein